MIKTKRRFHWFRIIACIFFFVIGLINLGMFIAVLFLEDDRYIASLKPIIIDETPPTIVLKGGDEISLLLNEKYEELGVRAYDNRCEPQLEISGEVDTRSLGKYEISYVATDESGNSTEKIRTINVVEPKRIVYLTFDDGPSEYTASLLDVLKKYNVLATFFVTGAGSDEVLRREHDEGHAIGLHSFSHNYSYIYANINNYFEDLDRVQDRVERVLEQKSYILRFPGGGSNTISRRYDGGSKIMSRLADEVTNRGFTYFDWNVDSNDAGGAKTEEEVYNNVVQALKEDYSIVLQHDTKGFSVNAVEKIIQYGLENNYTFMSLKPSSYTSHHAINN